MRHTSSDATRVRRALSVAFAVTLTWTLAYGAIESRAVAPPGARFTANVWFDGGACGPVGLGPAIYADLKAGTTMARARQIEKQYRPNSGATLTVNGRVYSLSRRGGYSSLSTIRIVWGFRLIRVSQAEGKAALGKTATIAYRTASGQRRQLKTRVSSAGCG